MVERYTRPVRFEDSLRFYKALPAQAKSVRTDGKQSRIGFYG
jgi:hypothetical protein